MKKAKKLTAVVLALMVALTMGIATTSLAFAQDKASGMGGDATITIDNAAKGETYKVVKLFDATITNPPSDAIAYTGTIPAALASYFVKDSAGNITLKKIADANGKNPGEEGYVDTFYKMTADDFAAMKTWAEGITADNTTYPNVSEVSDGSALNFTGLKYGYYVVVSTQGALVTVDSTNKNVTVQDKNTTTPHATKEIDKNSPSIGETVTYTATFDTANYIEENKVQYQVKSYTISDTLPEFLTNVQITSLKIIQTTVDADKTTYPDVDLSSNYTAFSNKKIVVPWVDANDTSLYKNGSQIVLTYTAKVTGTVNINTANTNTVTITPNKDKEGDEPFKKPYSADSVLKTYGTALKKVDAKTEQPLKGAKFKVKGLTVEPVTGESGVYKVVSYVASSNDLGTEMSTNDQGMLYIIGIGSSVRLSATETEAPDGYNKTDAVISLPAQLLTETLYETSGERYYDAKGNLVSESSSTTTSQTVTKNYTDLDEAAVQVVNNQGTELPETGGIGTTIFYILGALLVIGCGIVLIARRRLTAK